MVRILFMSVLLGLLLLSTTARAQFQFFEQMFGGGRDEGQEEQGQKNTPSDSAWYQRNYESGMLLSPIAVHFKDYPNLSNGVLTTRPYTAQCSKYLCPGTLVCVQSPHHCPCPHPSVEEKFELGDGSAICVSKGGYKAGEAARKVELARKGLL